MHVSATLSRTLANLAKLPWYHKVRLRSLKAAEVTELLARQLDAPTVAALTAVAQHRTEGNPLFLTEALRLLEHRRALALE